jgi:glycerol-3-phosphate dehydrogenase subunit C
MTERSQDRPMSFGPTEGLSYDPEEPRYWDATLLRGEIERAFELCNSCRLCFKYCDSFPTLFDLLDRKHGGDVKRIDGGDIDRVVASCFQCKLCEVQCPYTPREKHEFQLDFPRLIHRQQAVHVHDHHVPLRERLLGQPDLMARLARLSFGLANRANHLSAARWAMEKFGGIHHEKLLPDFSRDTFEQRAKRAGFLRVAPPAEVVLFQTCFVQHNDPGIGEDVLFVLQRNQVDVGCVTGLRCCGMPAWEHGDLATLRANARHNLDLLMPFVESGAKVLVINPTCSMMMRREYPELLPAADRDRATKLAAAVQDPCEYLWSIRGERRFSREFKSTPAGPVAYHAPCHLRAQAVGFKGRDLLRLIPGVTPAMVMECCGHNGTFAMKTEGFEPSRRLGQRAFDAMKNAGAQVWATECPLAALQFQQHAGTKPQHPLSILARAYREDGFATRVPPPEAAS